MGSIKKYFTVISQAVTKHFKFSSEPFPKPDSYGFTDELMEIMCISLKRLPNSIILLSKAGWYMTKQMTPAEIIYWGELVENDNREELDFSIVNHINDNVEYISRKIYDRFPERKRFLQSGFDAHKRRDYYASIPIFLSQADGICNQITGYKFYSKEKKIPKIAKPVNELREGTFSYILLQPLAITNSITANENEIQKYEGQLNRHKVLHGLSLDYGTEINSCKSISIINFISEIIWESDLKKESSD